MDLVHLWNQRNGYQAQLAQLQRHLDATDARIQEAPSSNPPPRCLIFHFLVSLQFGLIAKILRITMKATPLSDALKSL